MPPFPRRDSRPTPHSPESSGEFIAPAGPVRLRGTAGDRRAEDRGTPDRRASTATHHPARAAGHEAASRAPGPGGASPAPAVAATELKGSRSGPARDELKICGLAAVRARFARDPGSIMRLFFDLERSRQVGVMSKVLAQAKKIYRCVEPAELEKIAGSIHHGGIVAVVTPAALRTPTLDDLRAWARRGESLLVLDRIGNAHNLGAIARTAAFFGVPRLVIPDDAAAAKPNDAAHRVAEGGFEALEVWRVPSLVAFARELVDAGYDVVGAATRGGKLGGPAAKPAPGTTAVKPKPVALVLGNEEQGLSPDVAAHCTRLVTIPGSGKVESLNVSVAAAVLMWELVGRRG
jgi:TrmH RNA methyltransferase